MGLDDEYEHYSTDADLQRALNDLAVAYNRIEELEEEVTHLSELLGSY